MFDDLKNLFVQETKELLDNTQKSLIALENDIENPNLIAEIFRNLHTVKGSAGLYAFTKMQKLAHSFENIFSKIKENKLSPSQEIISLSLKALDLLKALLISDEDEKFDSEISNIIVQIENLTQTQQPNNTINTKQIPTFYIIFEPDADNAKKGIKNETVLADFDEFQYKIITELKGQNKPEGKDEKFYEIIVASEYSEQDLSAIFLFTPNQYEIKKICNFNLFLIPNFSDYYEKAIKILPFNEQRYELIKIFANQHEQDIHNIDVQPTQSTNKTEKQIKLIDVTKEKNIDYLKIPAQKLDDLLNLVSELIITNAQLQQAVTDNDHQKILNQSENIAKIVNSIKSNTLNLRLIPISHILEPYRRLVRDLSIKLNKKITFVEQGVSTQVDKTIIEKLYSPLLHIIRNAIDHGIEPPEERLAKGKKETGIIRFIAYYSNTNIIIQIQDDGRGIDPETIRKKAIELNFIKPTEHLNTTEIYNILFKPGFTISNEITDISGRGVGLDAIKQAITELRGDIEIDSEPGLGTSITIKLPFTLSIVETLHVSTAGINFLLPLSNIDRCLEFNDEKQKLKNNTIILDNKLIPIINTAEYLNLPQNNTNIKKHIVIINLETKKVALLFDKIHGEYQAVIKNIGSLLSHLDFILGASILGNGKIAYILSPNKLIKKVKQV